MKLLIVEDDVKLASILERALTEEGFIVEVIMDGAPVVERVLSVDYDLVILDWMLPNTDGITVCRALRARGNTTPILMLSALADVAERIIGLDAGADDYMGKPFDLSELLARIRAMGRRSAASSGIIKVGPLALDRFRRHAALNGQALDFTPREFSLLSYLAKEAGRAVSRKELLLQVWEIRYDTSSNVVEAHVKKVREKLGQYASMLETVRGIGYRVVVPGSKVRAGLVNATA
jgi:two-component system OmpR family response regulator